MGFLIPITKFDFVVDDNPNLLISSFKEKLLGERQFCIETLIGKKEAMYNGEFGNNQINFTRNIDSIITLPIYPTARITFLIKENQKMIKVSCSFSIISRIAIYLIYVLILFVFMYEWFLSNSFHSKMILLFKMFGSILILNIIVLGYHFTEVNNVKKIILDVLK